MDIKEYLANKKTIVETALNEFLPPEDMKPEVIHKAMRYSVFAGGKRLRPILLMASAEAVGGASSEMLPAACAMEMIHTYSLIHDDLPAMDNDDYRRGRPTNHKVFGEAMAILAGDALLTLAFHTLTLCSKTFPLDRVNWAVAEISSAAGSLGMVGGQVADLEAEGRVVTREELEFINSNKTSALFVASVRSGAILAGASSHQLEALTDYGRHLGLAFQIRDDILDITGDSTKLGKATGSDFRKKKATFPALYGLEEAIAMARDESKKAMEIAEALGSNAQPLAFFMEYLISRDR